jgi:Fic family protein
MPDMTKSGKKSKPLTKPLKKAGKESRRNRAQAPSLMEPMVLSSDSRQQSELADLALELATESTRFKSSIPPAFVAGLAVLVRAMNCYYSNLIEGHDTHPVDIERALRKDYSRDPEKRDLQLEAASHIAVQAWIDEGGLTNRPLKVVSIIEIHKRFYDSLPEALMWVQDPETQKKFKVVPGKLRERQVKVGLHVPVEPQYLPAFMERFESAYAGLSKVQSIIATAASHHRLLWIHPFLDGNGRVARLMSYAVFLDLLDTGGIWSIARGLARNQAEYKRHLMACDQPRHGDLDGRCSLSEEALAAFTRFFLQTCLDQVRFMASLIRPDLLRERVLSWAREEVALGVLPPRSIAVMESLLSLGELARGDVQSILNASPATARRVISALLHIGVVTSTSIRAPIRLAFPASLASRWLPGMFPEK